MPRGRPRKYPIDGLTLAPRGTPIERIHLLEIQNQELLGAYNDMVDKFNQVMTVVERRLQLLEGGVARPSADAVSGLENPIVSTWPRNGADHAA